MKVKLTKITASKHSFRAEWRYAQQENKKLKVDQTFIDTLNSFTLCVAVWVMTMQDGIFNRSTSLEVTYCCSCTKEFQTSHSFAPDLSKVS